MSLRAIMCLNAVNWLLSSQTTASTTAFIFSLAVIDSWNKLCIDDLHAQLIYLFVEWTLITNGEIRVFKRIRPEIRLHPLIFVHVHVHAPETYSPSQAAQAAERQPVPFLLNMFRNMCFLPNCTCSSIHTSLI